MRTTTNKNFNLNEPFNQAVNQAVTKLLHTATQLLEGSYTGNIRGRGTSNLTGTKRRADRTMRAVARRGPRATTRRRAARITAIPHAGTTKKIAA